MFKRTLTTLVAAALVSAATIAQAANTFPSAGVEGSEQTFRATTASTPAIGGTTMAIAAPSSSVEGSEMSIHDAGMAKTTLRNLDRSYATAVTSIFPDSSKE